MVMNIEFWKNKKVFVTGHTGFKGSWLCLWLQHMEADVFGYALAPPTSPNNFTESKRVVPIIGSPPTPIAVEIP